MEFAITQNTYGRDGVFFLDVSPKLKRKWICKDCNKSIIKYFKPRRCVYCGRLK